MRTGFIIGLVLVVASFAGGGSATAQAVHQIEVGGRIVQLSADEWRGVPTAEPFAVRFEARTMQRGEVFPQLLTVFKLPMQINERAGVALTADEFGEFMFLHPVKVTYRMRLDREAFWVESLQTFDVPIGMPLRVPWRLYERPTEDGFFLLLDTYDTEIKRTRFQLRQLF